MKKFTLDELKPELLPSLASDIVLCSDALLLSVCAVFASVAESGAKSIIRACASARRAGALCTVSV